MGRFGWSKTSVSSPVVVAARDGGSVEGPGSGSVGASGSVTVEGSVSVDGSVSSPVVIAATDGGSVEGPGSGSVGASSSVTVEGSVSVDGSVSDEGTGSNEGPASVNEYLMKICSSNSAFFLLSAATQFLLLSLVARSLAVFNLLKYV